MVWFRAEEDLQKWKVSNMEPVVAKQEEAVQAQSVGAFIAGAQAAAAEAPKSDGMSLYPETWTQI